MQKIFIDPFIDAFEVIADAIWPLVSWAANVLILVALLFSIALVLALFCIVPFLLL